MNTGFKLGIVKKAVMWVFAAFLIFILTGCTGAPGMTANEIERRQYNSIESNWKMVQDDVDAILLLDRPSRLSSQPKR